MSSIIPSTNVCLDGNFETNLINATIEHPDIEIYCSSIVVVVGQCWYFISCMSQLADGTRDGTAAVHRSEDALVII